MEYAPPGMAADLANTRLGAAKIFPDLIKWGDMQSAPDAAIDFTVLDSIVREYQAANYTHLMMALRSVSPWASRDVHHDHTPKPEFAGDFAAWVGAVVERYDGDGVEDMPGLGAPLRYLEIGVEFSSFEPESGADYIAMLATAHAAAHAASPDIVVLHAAFLTTTAFDGDPAPGGYAAAFAAMPPRIAYHDYGEIAAVLDRPDLFDAVNAHALESPYMLPRIVQWLRHEMSARGYNKPIVISDTSPNPLIAWGPASTCAGPPENLGIVLWPATEADRCDLAAYFSAVLAGETNALGFTRVFAAQDMVKRAILAADAGVAWINMAFMEDLFLLQLPILQAGAGTSAWGGMTATTVEAGTQQRRIRAHYPMYYALRQLADHLDGANIFRDTTTDANSDVYLYRLDSAGGASWIAWYEPPALVLPGSAAPTHAIALPVGSPAANLEWLLTGTGESETQVTTLSTVGGTLALTLEPTPVFVSAATKRD